MNILFLSNADIDTTAIYSDLLREFKDRGNNVYTVFPTERRQGKKTHYKIENGIHKLRVKTGNITKVALFEKGISTILIEQQFINALKKYFSGFTFDLILHATPPVTFERVIRYLKKRDGCSSYLLLKDIFPQNAVDLHVLRKGSLIWRYFRAKEKRLYQISDYIGCMSPANIAYVLEHNPEVPKDKVEECPNSIRPKPLLEINSRECQKIREKHAIPLDVTLFIYGGNLGKPQGIPFLLKALDKLKDNHKVFFLIVGSGTEYLHIADTIQKKQYSNVRLSEFLPKEDYDKLLSIADVGLIFLDSRFTIPNFPSRLTAYMEAAKPILAATDVNTDLKEVIIAANCGMWTESTDAEGWLKNVTKFAAESETRRQMGRNGRHYLEKFYTVSRAYDIITKHPKISTHKS